MVPLIKTKEVDVKDLRKQYIYPPFLAFFAAVLALSFSLFGGISTNKNQQVLGASDARVTPTPTIIDSVDLDSK